MQKARQNKREMLSPRYTTLWLGLSVVRANQLNNWGQIWGHLMAQGQYLGQKNDLE
ncbi:hypothetical protein [Enterobacter sp. C2]|uniref:hypothetical protein n=1 Tax=Enterobacter sp. C2 TaxID=2870346 RepID=UPI00336A6883